MQLERAEPRWSGRCVVAAPGPSLTPEIAEMCRGERVIAINDAYRLLPFAEVTYACDLKWWEIHRLNVLSGERWTSHSIAPKNDKTAIAEAFGLHVIAGANNAGFSRDPGRIHYGSNSGFQAVNLALLFGADPVILVGFDMRDVGGRPHFFGEHPAPLKSSRNYGHWIAAFAKANEMLWHPRPRILNATPGSALTCFPMVDLAETLSMAEAA